MKCVKCGQDNLKAIEFCVRCHHPLHYTCPACKHEQLQGGKCEKCGTDFAKYAAMLVMQAQSSEHQKREVSANRNRILKQVVLAILTGGLSLLFLHRNRVMDE